MGRLAAGTIAAIASGAPVRQTWTIAAPSSAGGGSSSATAKNVDRGLVVKAGSYTIEGYNVSMMRSGRLTSGLYQFTVDNSSGLFNTTTSGNIWYNVSGSYQADPVECFLSHRLQVLVGGTWTEILYYYGQVQDVKYDDTKETATIEAVGMASALLSQLWSADDGLEQDTGLDIYL